MRQVAPIGCVALASALVLLCGCAVERWPLFAVDWDEELRDRPLQPPRIPNELQPSFTAPTTAPATQPGPMQLTVEQAAMAAFRETTGPEEGKPAGKVAFPARQGKGKMSGASGNTPQPVDGTSVSHRLLADPFRRRLNVGCRLMPGILAAAAGEPADGAVPLSAPGQERTAVNSTHGGGAVGQ